MSNRRVGAVLRQSMIASTAAVAWCSLPLMAQAEPPLPGAIFTTDQECEAVNLNIYDGKGDVYLNGGPDHPGAAGLLPNTNYYVRVTDPSGQVVLGSSVYNTSLSKTPVRTNAAGNFVACHKLADIVSLANGTKGYADTPNPGGEYKVWVSTDPDFKHNSTKTDNFKVRCPAPPPDKGKIVIKKWYDKNTNGKWDFGEGEIAVEGWKVDLLGFAPKYTPAWYGGLALTDYTAREYRPDQLNWVSTNAYVNYYASNPVSSNPTFLNKITVTLTEAHPFAKVYFGNVCTGKGGGKTLGWWGNKNGKAEMVDYGMATLLAGLTSLNLVNADGSAFNPGSYEAFSDWLHAGNAKNMAYMLSVQLATMWLNVKIGHVDGAALVYAPGSKDANDAGFISVTALINEANHALGLDPTTPAGDPDRVYQEYLKDALDNANNNKTFVQHKPCPFTFTD